MYNTIKLDKGLYNVTSKSFTEALTDLDNDSLYEETDLKGLDAFERQLKRFDIKVSGEDSDSVEKFFATTESAVLFPEFVRRCIKQGMEECSMLDDIVAATSKTNAVDYRGLTITNPTVESNSVAESAEIPVTTIKMASTSTALTKFARKVSCSYETIRQQKLDVFCVALKAIGGEISKSLNDLAIKTLKKDVTPLASIEFEKINYTTVTGLWSSFGDDKLTTIVLSPFNMQKLLADENMKYGDKEIAQYDKVTTPFGANIVQTSSVTDDVILAINKNKALEMINGSDVIIDFDKLISTQMEDISFSITAGFCKILPEAVKTLGITFENPQS